MNVLRNVFIGAAILFAAAGVIVSVAFIEINRAGAARWEITVENLSDVPCSILVTMGGEGERTAKVDGLAKGKEIVLISAGEDIFIHDIKVVRGMDERVTPYKGVLRIGGRLSIVIFPDGRVSTGVDEDAMMSLQPPSVVARTAAAASSG